MAWFHEVRGAENGAGGGAMSDWRLRRVEVQHRRSRAAQRAGELRWLPGERRQRVAHHLEVVRHAFGLPRVSADVTAVGIGVEHRQCQLVARHSVDRRVMRLREHRDVALLEALDDPRLPQWLPPVERPGDDLLRQRGQLVRATRRGHRDVVEMEVEVEVGVLDPERMVEAERHLDEPPPEGRSEVETRRVHVADLVEPPRDRRRGRIEDHQPGHVHVPGGSLEVEETGVEPGQSLHGDPSAAVWHSLSDRFGHVLCLVESAVAHDDHGEGAEHDRPADELAG